jgi:murein DD-endopeptidase MepM/ murein hydrolase activator NlpD
LDLPFLPGWLQVTGQSFGAMLFMPKALPGLLVLAGLVVASRLSAILGLAGFIAGYSSMKFLGFVAEPEGVLWCGFNFLLCGISLGGGYYVPSRASLLLAITGAATCAPVAIAVAEALRYFGLPPSALPGNFVVLTLAYALRQRREAGGLKPCPAPGNGPERNARLILINSLRFPDLNTPALALPFDGTRTITQGFNGTMTHRGLWQHALDFELHQDGRAFRAEGVALEDYFTFDTPVLAPCNGVVTRIMDRVQDNLPGRNNPDQNWGNFTLIRADAGYHVLLAHFKKGGVQVIEGQRVKTGEMLGYCGNTGRSPVPHLHLHIQDSAELGAATRPFCLKHYLEPATDGKAQVYRTSGAPSSGAQISGARFQHRLGDALSGWIPGDYRYCITAEGNHSWEETLVLDFDDLGRFSLRSKRHGGQLTMFISEGVFYATDFVGKGNSLLAVLATGLARVPFIGGTDIVWHDTVSAVPFMKAPLRWAHDTLDPFLGPAVLPYEYRLVNELTGTAIRCKLADAAHVPAGASHQAPQEIMTKLHERSGISSINLRFGNDRLWAAECVHHEPRIR